ncbi:hypothetical protein [Burkholderia diffusa]|uniref:hypothetical protein n=1 Tax=Burkholderia diffusa TaxID=488732 RepID=UPI00157AEAC3|nr:hypothetical protein [Burkholderia diffusa]NTY41467.1 hypothetical protein [Burkholderia diffusa]
MQGHSTDICRLSIAIVVQRARFVRISSLIEPAAAYPDDPGGLSRNSICVMISILIFMLTGRRAFSAHRPLF